MGFRNPPTSASAVDTGDTAGVRLYGNAANPGAGVVQWYVGGNRAEATLTGSQTGSGGTSWTVGLTSTAIGGGPSLALNVLDQGAGGYQGVASLAADRVSVQAAALDVGTSAGAAAYWRSVVAPDPILVSYLAGWGPWQDTAGGYKHLRFTLLASGVVHVSGLCNYTGGGTNKITGVSGEFSPARGTEILACSVSDTARWCDLTTDGLYLRGALPAAGSWLAVNATYLAKSRTTA